MKLSDLDLRRKGHKETVAQLYKQMRSEQFKKVADYFLKEWKRDQDLKDQEFLSLYEEGGELG